MKRYKTTIKTIDTEGAEHTSFAQHAWRRYLNGYWTTERPNKSGRYTVASSSGRICGEVIFFNEGSKVKMVLDEDSASIVNSEWDGYYWSESIPAELPTPFFGKDDAEPFVEFIISIKGEGGASVSPHVLAAWDRFIRGSWTQKVPDAPGRYLTVDEDGHLNGEILVYKNKGVLCKSFRDSAIGVGKKVPKCWLWNEAFPVVMPDMLPMRNIVKQLLLARERRLAQRASASRSRLALVTIEG